MTKHNSLFLHNAGTKIKTKTLNILLQRHVAQSNVFTPTLSSNFLKNAFFNLINDLNSNIYIIGLPSQDPIIEFCHIFRIDKLLG